MTKGGRIRERMKELDIAAMPAANRVRLIGELASRVRDGSMTPKAREEALSLIGRLARRAEDEPPDSTTLRVPAHKTGRRKS
jgi:hypothetical protein